MSTEKQAYKKECVEVKFVKGWRGHAEGATATLSCERACELHASGTCKISEAGKKVCESDGFTITEPKKKPEPKK